MNKHIPHKMWPTLMLFCKTGHKANSSNDTVTTVKACQAVCSLEAKHTDANTAAFSDTAPGTLGRYTFRYILGQKSSATTVSDISHLMNKACMIKFKISMCLLGCQLNTSMTFKEITLMNTWKIWWEHGHPLVFLIYTIWPNHAQIMSSKKMPNLTHHQNLRLFE